MTDLAAEGDPVTDVNDLAWQCFLHFYGLDISNAAIHCASVRFSPITFRLQEHLDFTAYRDKREVQHCRSHHHAYVEDKGR